MRKLDDSTLFRTPYATDSIKWPALAKTALVSDIALKRGIKRNAKQVLGKKICLTLVFNAATTFPPLPINRHLNLIV